MEKDIDITRVNFRMTPKRAGEPEIIAFFPDAPARFGRILSYMHIGQHEEAAFDYFLECTPATPKQYEELKKELESLGYNLNIYKGSGSHYY